VYRNVFESEMYLWRNQSGDRTKRTSGSDLSDRFLEKTRNRDVSL
jgi:hypothetical protein